MIGDVSEQSKVANKDGKRVWYPQTVASGRVIDTKRVARELAARSGASEGDVHGILHDLGLVLRDYLSTGARVVLDGVGSFRITANARGKGVEKKEDVSPRQFNSIRVAFYPEKRVNQSTHTTNVTLIDPNLRFVYVKNPKDAAGNASSQTNTPDSPTPPNGGGEQGSQGGGL